MRKIESGWLRIGFVFLLMGLAVSAFGRGTPEGAWQDVDGTENWRHEIDVSETEPGLYNVIIRGVDFAGNEYIEGPYNILVDPESDKPVSRIIYPSAGKVVRGAVDIVGVSVDDDAVGRVEVRVNEGEWRQAEGTEYWRLQIPAEELANGEHLIEVRAFDVNELEGDIFADTFLLDTRPPEMAVTSHPSGSIVNGRVAFSGTVSDANGIETLELSRDGRETYEEVKTKFDREAGLSTFEFDVRTEDNEDGPQIYWLRATDVTGATSMSPFLFFVDNESPVISVYEPEEESPVNGVTRLAGSIRDRVGIERFWYVWNEEEVEIPLVPGNPFWTIGLDTRDIGGSKFDVQFFALDTSGNEVEFKYRLMNDQDSAMPRIVIQAPDFTGETPVEEVAADASIYGVVEGINRAVKVRVTGLGGEEAVEFPAYPAFEIPLADAPAGGLDLQLVAVDELGYESDALRLRFTHQAAVREITIDSLIYNDGNEQSFGPGLAFDSLKQGELRGSIVSAAKIDEVIVQLGTGDSAQDVKVSTGGSDVPNTTAFSFSLPPAASVGYGVVPIELTARDEFGAESSVSSFVLYRDVRRIEVDPLIWIDDERVAGAADSTEVGAAGTTGGLVRLSGQNAFVARLIGTNGSAADTFSSVRLDPSPGFLELSHDAGVIQVTARSEGRQNGVMLRAETVDGVELEAGPFQFVVDQTVPSVEISEPASGDLAGGRIAVSGTIGDSSQIVRADISFDGGVTFESLAFDGAGDSAGFSASHALGEKPEDGYGIIVRAWDAFGNYGYDSRVLNRLPAEELPTGEEAAERRNDTAEAVVLFPGNGSVNQFSDPEKEGAQPLIVSGFIHDLDGAQFLEASLNGGEFRRVAEFDDRAHHQLFSFDLSVFGAVKPGSYELVVRPTDRQGLVGREARTRFSVASPSMDIQLQQIVLTAGAQPALQGFRMVLGERAQLTGIVSNGERLDSLQWRIDGGEWASASARASENDPLAQTFSVSMPGNLAYGRHVLEIQATDDDGLTAWRRIGFAVTQAGNAPARTNEVYFADARVSDESIIVDSDVPVGAAFTGRPISDAQIIGGGGLFELQVNENRVALYPIKQGSTAQVAILVTTVDGLVYESPGRSATVDSIAPELTVSGPEQGFFARATVPLRGSLTDAVGVDGLYYRVGHEGEFTQISLGSGGSFSLDLDVSTLEKGPVHVYLQGRDTAGRVANYWLPVVFDPDAPEIRFVTPGPEDVVNGLTGVTALVESMSPIVQLSYSLDGSTFTDLPVGNAIDHQVDFSQLNQQGRQVIFRAVDAAGNTADASPQVQVNIEEDLPVVEVQIPEPDAVITDDFTLSGMAFDDDKVKEIYWRIDDGEYTPLTGANSFSVDIPLGDLTDNEHVLQVYAVDEYGLEGEVQERTIRVSLQEPTIRFEAPSVEVTNRDTVRIQGGADDENGISEVLLSFDNGNTFLRARGTDEWYHDLNTTVFEDGTFSVQVVAVDNYGIPSNFFTLVNIDNTAPILDVTLPDDNDVVSQEMSLNGRVDDNIGVVSLGLEVEPISRSGSTLMQDLPLDTVLQDTVDISSLSEGWYNVRLTAVDAADNKTVVARNVFVRDDVESSFSTLLFPQDGASIAGPVLVEGVVGSAVPVSRAQLFVNGEFHDAIEVNSRGYYRYRLEAEFLQEGENIVQVSIEPGSEDRVSSREIRFDYSPYGPYATIESHQVGDFVSSRPWISGVAGYTHDLDVEARENRDALRRMEVERVMISLDNGRTFMEADGGEEWRYRIETADVPEGPLAVIVRAEYKNGSEAVSRSMLTVDKTRPEVGLLRPSEDTRLNDSISMVGTAEDEHGIESIQAALRTGNKSSYAVPGFIQGLYLDAHIFGLTYWEVGLGFTFFDQNVKLQGQYGVGPEFTEDDEPVRFGGQFVGGKLLANVASLPFNAFLGPDWEFLSMNIALGAIFDYIILYEPMIPSGMTAADAINGIVLSAIVAQLEFPKFTIGGLKAFNAYSFYTEPQFWFVPSDASPDIFFRLTFGARVQLF